eukprot:maker-scaffold591_size129331-snap-gene-0.20 protein:Tk08231 transcript:maker-scaffold591_size129331-snap-gene-0.20-mRNA-1 annotation:"lactoylglutathione lyase"
MSDHHEDESFVRGVSNLWAKVNHIALVVSDVGRSLQFYTDVVGMRQILRPNFDRHGAWLTAGNVDIHLIKGRPAVHSDDDLIVSHVAIEVDKMDELRTRLAKLGTQSRKNISVPNPEEDNRAVDQAFVRDPDGYYIEFCNCAGLDEYLHKTPIAEQAWDFNKAHAVASASKLIRKMANSSRVEIEKKRENYMKSLENGTLIEDVKEVDAGTEPAAEADPVKLANLVQRRNVYGDITQNTENTEELEELLKRYHNHVPKVVRHLEERVWRKGSQTYIPPAFYDRDGTFYQPPSFEMKLCSLIDINKAKEQ